MTEYDILKDFKYEDGQISLDLKAGNREKLLEVPPRYFESWINLGWIKEVK